MSRVQFGLLLYVVSRKESSRCAADRSHEVTLKDVVVCVGLPFRIRHAVPQWGASHQEASDRTQKSSAGKFQVLTQFPLSADN